MGLIMGAVVHDMPLGQAFETYAILTVGDGLVSQIPAVIISIAAALLLARGGAIGSTDLTLFSQLGRHPAALLTVGAFDVDVRACAGLAVSAFLAWWRRFACHGLDRPKTSGQLTCFSFRRMTQKMRQPLLKKPWPTSST